MQRIQRVVTKEQLIANKLYNFNYRGQNKGLLQFYNDF